MAELYERLCLLQSDRPPDLVHQWSRTVSTLQKGVFWYVLTGTLPAVQDVAAGRVVLHMVIVVLMCTLLCWSLKAKTSRPWHYQVNQATTRNVKLMDPFSFPLGHSCMPSHLPPLLWPTIRGCRGN